jgi:CMP-N,N'-diacetyllegionaminic acid synthase
MADAPRAVAFIPARAGSKRVPDKNVRILAGHPMLAYSICAARESGVFNAVICATDSPRYADIARHYGAEVPWLRPGQISGDTSADIEWVRWALDELTQAGRAYDAFSILRPTSPFRLGATIRRAWQAFLADPAADSLRAVEKCRQHPGKMWVIRGARMLPLMPFANAGVPWHSSQYSSLPEVYAQDASLEIAWTRVPLQKNSIAGDAVIPFISQGLEGFDINAPEDWLLAEQYLASKAVELPAIDRPAFRVHG